MPVPPDRGTAFARLRRTTLAAASSHFLSAIDWKEQGLEVVARVDNLDAGCR